MNSWHGFEKCLFILPILALVLSKRNSALEIVLSKSISACKAGVYMEYLKLEDLEYTHRVVA